MLLGVSWPTKANILVTLINKRSLYEIFVIEIFITINDQGSNITSAVAILGITKDIPFYLLNINTKLTFFDPKHRIRRIQTHFFS